MRNKIYLACRSDKPWSFTAKRPSHTHHSPRTECLLRAGCRGSGQNHSGEHNNPDTIPILMETS